MAHYMLDRSFDDPAAPGGRAHGSADIQASSDNEAVSQAKLLAQTGTMRNLWFRVRRIGGAVEHTILDWQPDER